MIAPLVTRFLQHITQQNNWARPHLMPFAGQMITFDFVLMQAHLIILEDGSLAIAPDRTQADATVHIPPSLSLRLATGDAHAKSLIKVEGDLHLATEVSKVLQQMRWDIEEDISHVVGDIAAFKLGEVSKSMFAQAKKQSTDLADMVSEYWQEEKNILAKKTHVTQFNDAVDTLRHDVERFEKRIDKLTQSITPASTSSDEAPAAKPKKPRTRRSPPSQESA
ncbi:hypothetical protein Meth11DRAFT_1968 [Methylophilaceae bacterium 11]|jgi:ubiquinone biosynthesis protein UbiJ|uniref:ubiquinone biosynthesis accessory factor UbiJ n=1 Tax=Methylotenera sp. 1P/1 TaxID=1131551 RepID=UPI000367D158|nr:SCP2 sterol-binding domain-containing protein [Methylotenera sp. 1P/1]EUJ11130.1 hypothetical protein Meth11DRAFT_1968 [Methylophilaceae bacterium 11]